MGKNSAIEWTDHTFNPVWGCRKISPGCDNCYAERLARRFGREHLWTGWIREVAPVSWAKPEAWNRQAARLNRRYRVLCGSMTDICLADPRMCVPRNKLWPLIERTSCLDWLCLTKRTQNIRTMVPASWGREDWPPNIWMMFSAENQEWYEKRGRYMDTMGPGIHGISMEPLLGPIRLAALDVDLINWVIVGGETGPGARPMSADWVRDIRDQCEEHDIPFFFKQWGEFNSTGQRVGKKRAGCELDGIVYRQFPR